VIERTQEEFMAARQPLWNELDGLLGDGTVFGRHNAGGMSRMAALYRMLCGDLMAAQSRAYSPDLVDFLDGLAARASNTLYGPRSGRMPGVWDVIWRRFPATLRKRWKFFMLAWLLFGVPLAIGVYGTLQWEGFAEQVLPSSQLAVMAEMYSDGYDAGRPEAVDTMMFGHYVQNNIGIAFRCFATGILLGLGSIYFLVYNGLMIGTTLGYVVGAGYGSNILTFVCGHGVFELTAIVVSGGAGLQMGWALVETQGRTRLGSLRAQAPDLIALVAGAAVMLAIAAVLEGFWSPSSIPPPVKWAASGVFAILLTAFLIFAGRDRERKEGPQWT
jgi:uncharacterized membrane protein SpoIIM required for sporulation